MDLGQVVTSLVLQAGLFSVQSVLSHSFQGVANVAST